MEEFRLLGLEQAQGPVSFYVADLILHKNDSYGPKLLLLTGRVSEKLPLHLMSFEICSCPSKSTGHSPYTLRSSL